MLPFSVQELSRGVPVRCRSSFQELPGALSIGMVIALVCTRAGNSLGFTTALDLTAAVDES